MPTRNVVLTERHEKLIEGLVSAGRYQNASEILREGLRLVEQREAEDAAKLAVLRAAVQKGIESIERGEYRDLDSFDELGTYLDGISEKIASGTGTP